MHQPPVPSSDDDARRAAGGPGPPPAESPAHAVPSAGAEAGRPSGPRAGAGTPAAPATSGRERRALRQPAGPGQPPAPGLPEEHLQPAGPRASDARPRPPVSEAADRHGQPPPHRSSAPYARRPQTGEARGGSPVPAGRRPLGAGSVQRPPAPAEPPCAHGLLICVALPGLAVSGDHGQLTGSGLEGFYHGGRRLLSRCQVRVAGREPVTVQARMAGAGRARFAGTVRISPHAGPDPDVMVERIRSADGTERITLHSAAPRSLRLPVEVVLGTDLAALGAIGAGRTGRELPAGVHGFGLRWTGPDGGSSVTADPPPDDAVASAGLLRWELELAPGGRASIELRVRPTGGGTRPAVRAAAGPLAVAEAAGDDPGAAALLRTGVEDLRALLLRDPAHPADTYAAAGAPWRCGHAPAEALAAARMALPLGTRLAAGTLRSLARTQITGFGARSGMIPGPLRDAGAHLPPGCTGTEATLLFPVLLAEARRWGMPERETEALLPAAERCLHWMRRSVGDGVYLPDPRPGGPARCDTQAHAHRAALLGADLLDALGRPGGAGLREWARALRTAFRNDFWCDDLAGGRPAAARTADGHLVRHLGAAAATLLDTGLLGFGQYADGLLDKARTGQLARLLGSPPWDSGWGLRSLGAEEAGYNPFGHRTGAVRVHETAIAVAGLAVAGHEKEATSLLRGLLAAAGAFGHRLPEMYAGEQRTAGGAPLPHPAACRPAATSAAAGVLLLSTLVGIRPDVPAGTVTLRPLRGAPLGELALAGLRVAGAPFSVRVTRLGTALVEEAAEGLRLGT